MEKIETVCYKTTDGKIFETESMAQEHEKELSNVKAFKVYAHPDLTEGRYGPSLQGYLLVHANKYHDEFAKHWAYTEYGNEIAFVMGAYGSNAIIGNWKVTQCDIDSIESDKIVDKIEENFIKKIWEEE